MSSKNKSNVSGKQVNTNLSLESMRQDLKTKVNADEALKAINTMQDMLDSLHHQLNDIVEGKSNEDSSEILRKIKGLEKVTHEYCFPCSVCFTNNKLNSIACKACKAKYRISEGAEKLKINEIKKASYMYNEGKNTIEDVKDETIHRGKNVVRAIKGADLKSPTKSPIKITRKDDN